MTISSPDNNVQRVGVIFDMDGVLIDSADSHYESWRQLACESGAVVTREQFAATFGRQNRDIIPSIFGNVTEDRMRELADRKEQIYRDLISDSAPIIDGATELVRALSDAGALLAIGSSGPRVNIDLVLKIMNVRDLFSVVISADDVTRGKPDPQVFTLACERLGLHPSRCVVVEDAPTGVEAAIAAGTRVAAITIHHPARAFNGTDLIAEKLRDVTDGQLMSLVEV